MPAPRFARDRRCFETGTKIGLDQSLKENHPPSLITRPNTRLASAVPAIPRGDSGASPAYGSVETG
jgi:hypothetical protein